tara:strand:+ start:97 stop:468 length:372 start_codon:yes stop_codon:yes gene_type:complete
MSHKIENYLDHKAPNVRHQHGHRRRSENWYLDSLNTRKQQVYFIPDKRWNSGMSVEEAQEYNNNAEPMNLNFKSQYKWCGKNQTKKKKNRVIAKSRTRKYNECNISHEQDWLSIILNIKINLT